MSVQSSSPATPPAVEARVTFDFDLVQRGLAGDMEAVELLYQRYGAFCYSYAKRLGAELDDAEDVVQELFLRLTQGRSWRMTLEQLPPDGLLNGYLAGAVKHMTRSKRRNRGLGTGGDPAEYAGQVLEASPVWPIHTDNPEDKALRLERLERLRWAIAALTQRQRQIATLRYLECLSSPEIATAVGTSASVVVTTLYKIREALRPQLACVYQLPDKARYGYVKFGAHRGASADRPRNERHELYRARQRRQRQQATA